MDKISITVFVYDGFRYWVMRNLKSIYLMLHREHSRCRHGDDVSLSLCKVLLRDGVKNAVGRSNGDVTAKFGGRVFITTLFQGRSHWANQPCSQLREGELLRMSLDVEEQQSRWLFQKGVLLEMFSRR